MKEEDSLDRELNCEDGICETRDIEVNSLASKVDSVEKQRLLYFGDPMCSWCWGITNHLEKIKEEWKKTFDFELVLGGLRPGGGDAWTPEFREMIRSHWEHVQKASGQPFDYRFFDQKEFNYDTEPPARAVRVIRDLAPEKEWLFYKSLQRMFYAENRDIQDLSELEKVCFELGIDFIAFESRFLSQEYKQLVQKDFMKSQHLGVRGFPAVVLQKGEEYYAVTMGYTDYSTMTSNIKKILS
ncbi:MAG: DsbA family protein [Reichenbachiella sp.]